MQIVTSGWIPFLFLFTWVFSFLFWGHSRLPTSPLCISALGSSVSKQELGRERERARELSNPLPFRQTTRNIWMENREFRTHPSSAWMSPTMLGSDCALGVWTPCRYPTKPKCCILIMTALISWEECVGACCCRMWAVLGKVCNFLSLSGVKGVIFLSAFRSQQAETVFSLFFYHLIACISRFSCVFSD